MDASDKEPYVVGLLLALVVMSAIPQLAGAAVFLGCVLLLGVWTAVHTQNGSYHV